MARPRSAHVTEVKAALTARLDGRFGHPGGRFLSARAVAQRFTVSYQTAHRLLDELKAEGRLQREPASGTFLPGQRVTLRGAQLIFHRRAQRKGSFGAHLMKMIEARLDEHGIDFVRSWWDERKGGRLLSDRYPILWECPGAEREALQRRQFALLLNDRPPAGLAGAYIDAVTTDDFSGGACAAELLKQQTGSKGAFAVLGGPREDERNVQRIAGFKAHANVTQVICADSWFVESGREHVSTLLSGKPAGIFACNDRLAQAVLEHCRAHHLSVPLVGFDNAPVAERLRLTTIGIPWEAFVAHVMEKILARLSGSNAKASIVSLSHDVVLRLTT
jgi:DNA-binding transcriptional regulator YhcF (GntR family)